MGLQTKRLIGCAMVLFLSAIKADAGGVVVMREGNGLVVGGSLAGGVPGLGEQEKSQEDASPDRRAGRETRLRQAIGLLREKLRHT